MNAASEEDWLRVSAWYRAGGLALAPVTLVNGRVDNPPAAQAFVEKLEKRKTEVAGAFGLVNVLNYCSAWILAAGLMLGLFQAWRRKSDSSDSDMDQCSKWIVVALVFAGVVLVREARLWNQN